MTKSKPVQGTETPAVSAAPAVAIAKPIFVLAKVNPKKPGSLAAARFALYKDDQSVTQYVEACIAAGQSRRNATADIAWDLKHGFIAHEKPKAEVAASK